MLLPIIIIGGLVASALFFLQQKEIQQTTTTIDKTIQDLNTPLFIAGALALIIVVMWFTLR